jgi:hypothetical protein
VFDNRGTFHSCHGRQLRHWTRRNGFRVV